MNRTSGSFCALANIRALHEVGSSLNALDVSEKQRVLGEVEIKMGIRLSRLESAGARRGGSAMCCDFGVEARAITKNRSSFRLAIFLGAPPLLPRAFHSKARSHRTATVAGGWRL